MNEQVYKADRETLLRGVSGKTISGRETYISNMGEICLVDAEAGGGQEVADTADGRGEEILPGLRQMSLVALKAGSERSVRRNTPEISNIPWAIWRRSRWGRSCRRPREAVTPPIGGAELPRR